jgi:acyl-CoA dehydrogenase
MRTIGMAERALKLMCERAVSRVAFGKPIAQQAVTQERIAEARMHDRAGAAADAEGGLDDGRGRQQERQGRDRDDQGGGAEHGQQVIDWAMQVHGGAGMCQDFPLAFYFTHVRTLRFADGPDEVHRNAIAKIELGKHAPR